MARNLRRRNYLEAFAATAAATAIFLAGKQALERPAGISIHEIAYVSAPDPSIRQDRTVTAESFLVAIWSARIEKAESGEREIVCAGTGSWRYSPRRAAHVIPLDEWVGEPGCFTTLDRDTRYVACATYEWGDAQTVRACSAAFRPRDVKDPIEVRPEGKKDG